MEEKKASVSKVLFSWPMLVMVLFGFSSGLPFLVTKDVIKTWLKEANTDITVIGLFSAVGLPYTLKFMWSPVVDAVPLPFMGRRRSWILVFQVCVAAAIASLGLFNPSEDLWTMAFVCILIAFFSASQDIALDAFRREYLTVEELGAGTGIWMNAYRLANVASLGVAIFVADKLDWSAAMIAVACLMGFGIVATFAVKEPEVDAPPPRGLKQAVVEPFLEFMRREGAFWILAFMVLFKIGDNMAFAMNVPFILDLGFSKMDYLVIVKGVGLIALFGGAFASGVLMIRLGVNRSLWVFGILQLMSVGAFGVLHHFGKNYEVLTAVVVFELFATGLCQTAFGTYIALQTNKRFTATQYALLTSFMAIPVTVAAALTGYMVKFLGWPQFYLTCALFGIPGILLLLKLAPWNAKAVEAG